MVTRTHAMYFLSLHDALPISLLAGTTCGPVRRARGPAKIFRSAGARSEEHTSELQSRFDLVCRLLLEKKKTLCHQQKPKQERKRSNPTSITSVNWMDSNTLFK